MTKKGRSDAGADAAMKPLIGVTSCSRVDDYVSAVERAGGRVRVLDVSQSPRALAAELHGLLLTGGGDVDPVLYGESRHATVEDAEPGRDEFEIDLARRALDGALPTFAICRGMQVLNVAAGGSLVQDIPSIVGTDIRHSITTPKDAVAHGIHVTANTRLQHALGPDVDDLYVCRVNSRHHQSVARIGRGLNVTATAPDGVIEALEAPDAAFCVGVQWHPENFWRSGEFRGLFAAFVKAAEGRR